MRDFSTLLVIVSGLVLGCDSSPEPKLTIPTPPKAASTLDKASAARSSLSARQTRYHGKTAEEWARDLSDLDLDKLRQACLSLRILGAEGRSYLIQGLESPQAETRRMCLEVLSISDLLTLGEEGRQLLVKLAGDPQDIRIRERASEYLRDWKNHIPAR